MDLVRSDVLVLYSIYKSFILVLLLLYKYYIYSLYREAINEMCIDRFYDIIFSNNKLTLDYTNYISLTNIF